MFDEYGEEQIKKQGIKQGITQTIHNTVLRMHKEGLDIKLIAKIAGITEQEVDNILIK